MPEEKLDPLAPEELEQVPEHLEDEEVEGSAPGSAVSMLHQLAKCIG
jgi:hypothetical protein